jgi:uncharacterized sporulation protein YeaH/YhbH (DUF444 family)
MIFSENLSIMVILDTSGSMGIKEKRVSDALIKRFLGDNQQPQVFANVYKIAYHQRAEHSDAIDLLKWHANGGTRCSSAFACALRIAQQMSPMERGNLFIIHITDGDNERMDGPTCIKLLTKLLNCCKHFAYIEINTNYRKSIMMQHIDHVKHERFSAHIVEFDSQIDDLVRHLKNQLFKTQR